MKLCRIPLKITRTHFAGMNGIQCLFDIYKYIHFLFDVKCHIRNNSIFETFGLPDCNWIDLGFELKPIFLRTYANWTECINFVNFIPWYQHAQVSDDDLWCNISCLRGWQGCSNNCKGSLYKDCACCVVCVPLWNGKNCGHFKWKKLETGFNYLLSKIV